MAETLTVCHDCNRSTSGRCWRHSTITIRLSHRSDLATREPVEGDAGLSTHPQGCEPSPAIPRDRHPDFHHTNTQETP